MNPILDFSNRALEKVRGPNEVLMRLLLFVEYLHPVFVDDVSFSVHILLHFPFS
jgi:hypothetical protein